MRVLVVLAAAVAVTCLMPMPAAFDADVQAAETLSAPGLSPIQYNPDEMGVCIYTNRITGRQSCEQKARSECTSTIGYSASFYPGGDCMDFEAGVWRPGT